MSMKRGPLWLNLIRPISLAIQAVASVFQPAGRLEAGEEVPLADSFFEPIFSHQEKIQAQERLCSRWLH